MSQQPHQWPARKLALSCLAFLFGAVLLISWVADSPERLLVDLEQAVNGEKPVTQAMYNLPLLAQSEREFIAQALLADFEKQGFTPSAEAMASLVERASAYVSSPQQANAWLGAVLNNLKVSSPDWAITDWRIQAPSETVRFMTHSQGCFEIQKIQIRWQLVSLTCQN